MSVLVLRVSSVDVFPSCAPTSETGHTSGVPFPAVRALVELLLGVVLAKLRV